MEGYLRIGLLILTSIVLFFILFERWSRRRYSKMAELTSVIPVEAEDAYPHATPDAFFETSNTCIHIPPARLQNNIADNIIALYIIAKPGSCFESYDLLQTIAGAGMQLGERSIFHYYQFTGQEKTVLFSLASATKSGDFDWDHIGDFSCSGLILFMEKDEISDDQHIFEMMLETAKQLADDLDAELHESPGRVLDEEKLRDSLYKSINAEV